MIFNIKIDFPDHAKKGDNKAVLKEIKAFLEGWVMRSEVTINTDWEDEKIKLNMEVLT